MAYDDDRRTAAQRGYGSRWQKARESYLQSHPLCSFHQARGQVVLATVVDHKIPHKGDQLLFWDRDNWQSLCKPCHDSHKQRAERGGLVSGCDLAGIPLDPRHPWARREG
jgi:5-methylcytosine-specific restriction protein A